MEKQPNEHIWKKRLSAEQYRVLREKGTECAFTGQYLDLKNLGTYTCAACGAALFSSKEKYDSGSGWPSFWDMLQSENILLEADNSHGTLRTEVLCNQCHSHLGHVFDDGPPPTGKRYCINSISLQFVPEES